MNFGLIKNSRSNIFAWILSVAFILIVMRLFYLQIIKHDHYVAMAKTEQVKSLVIPAQRGEIFAMSRDNIVPLAMNQQVYTLFVDPTVIKNPHKVEEVVRRVAGGELVSDDILSLIKKKNTQYSVLARNVTLRQAEMIKKEKLKGVGFQKVSKRVYPEGDLASQTLGFVNNEGSGQYGVEEFMNKSLSGKDGLLKTVTDIADVPLSIGKDNIHRNPQNGENVVLSIDRNIQSKTEEALKAGLDRTGATDGAVIVMNPQNGQIVSMASSPGYSPENFDKVDHEKQFYNVPTMIPYEPGSVVKLFTVAMGIDQGKINAGSTFYNTDSVRIEDYTISNAHRGITGNITIQQALNYSLNTGMVYIAMQLGNGNYITKQARDTMYDYYHNRYGFGRKTGVEVAGESAGRIISPEDKSGEGNAVRYSNMSFGQGMNLTMIQVAAALSSLINGGNYYKPTIVAGTEKDGQLIKKEPVLEKQGVISKSTSDQIREMAFRARTAFTHTDKPGFYVGGKTGTSQTLDSSGKYTSKQTVGTYIGFGGTKNKSKYVIMVQVSGKNMNLEGDLHAMPIFTDISNWLLSYYNLQPKE